MAANKEYVVNYLGMAKGCVNYAPDELISDNEHWYTSNVLPYAGGLGVLERRSGIAKYNANMSSTRTHIGSVYYDGRLAKLVYTDQSATNWDVRGTAGTSLYTGTATLAFPCWRSFNGYMLCVDGTNYIKSVDGVAFTVLANIPAGAKYIEVYNNYLFAAGQDNNSARWADLGTVETWTSTNSLTFTTTTESALTGIKKYKDVLIVFFENSYHHIQGYAQLGMSVTYSNYDVGCMSNRSIINTPFGLFWMSKRGLVGTKDGYNIDYIMDRKIPNAATVYSYNISPLYDTRLSHGVYNHEQRCVSVFYPTGSATIPTDCSMRFDYYPETDAAYFQVSLGVEMASSGYYPAGAGYLYVTGGYGNTYVYNASNGGVGYTTDNTAGYTSYITTKRFSHGNANAFKVARNVLLTVKLGVAGDIIFKYVLDNADIVSAPTYSKTLTLGTGLQDILIPINQQYRKIQYLLETSIAGRTQFYNLIESGTMMDNR